MKNICYFLLAFTLVSCRQQQESKDNHEIRSFKSEAVEIDQSVDDVKEVDIPEEDDTYHIDKRYKYEYRTGEAGEYSYNYDITGFNEEGELMHGNIDIEGKYGRGYIEDEEGNEIYVEVEWVSKGLLSGTDEEGNTYEFEVDQ